MSDLGSNKKSLLFKGEDDKQDTDVKGEKKISKTSSEEICQFFLDYHKRKQIALGLGEIELDSHDNDEHAAEATADDIGEDVLLDRKPEIPLHLKYVKQVGYKTIYSVQSASNLHLYCTVIIINIKLIL